MKWIIGIFMVLDCCYQLFCNHDTVSGKIFYDATHYGAFLSICTYYLIIHNDKLFAFLGVYFVTILAIVLSRIGMTTEEFINSIDGHEPVRTFSYLAIFLLIIFTIWKFSKKVGR